MPTLILLSLVTLVTANLLTLTIPVKRRNSPLFDEQAYRTILTSPYLGTHCIMDYYWLSACARPN